MTLVAHYRLNEAAGTSGANSVVDASGNALHGTPTGCTFGGAGKIDKAVSLNGTSDKITLPDNAAFDFGNGTNDFPFTFAGWFWFQEARYHTILSRLASAAAAQYVLRVNATGSFGVFLYDGTTSNNNGRATADGVIALPSSGWVHLAATYSGVGGTGVAGNTRAGEGVTLYVNGSAVSAAVSASGTYTAMDNTIAVPEIGYRFDVFGYAKFIADDVRIYNEALTAAQIAAIVAVPNELPYPWLAKRRRLLLCSGA